MPFSQCSSYKHNENNSTRAKNDVEEGIKYEN